MKRLVIAFVTILLLTATPHAEVLTTGNWNTTIGSSDLIAGAGTTLPQNFESMSGVTTLTIANEPGPWRLVARRSDTKWNGTVNLMIKRTSDGAGAGSISGGSSYVEITSVDSEICSGSGDRSNIAVQYKLSGMSLTVSPDLYSTSIIFTIVH